MIRYPLNRNVQYNRNYWNYWFIKFWITMLIIITIIYLFSMSYIYPFGDIPSDLTTLRRETPAYPPPLINFMDRRD